MSTSNTSNLVTQSLLGTPLLVTDYSQLIAECNRWAALPRVTAVEFANTQIVTMRRAEASFREITDGYDYFVPDGMPLIWCLNVRGARMPDRVYGPTFMRECLQSPVSPRKHYLLGGSEELGERLRKVIHAWNPANQIVGSFHGHFTLEGSLKGGNEADLIEEINRTAPDYIWVGLGTPKQQAWIHRNKAKLNRGVIFGVGFGFDVNAGMKPDAPAWMQRNGLTWLFRMVTEPRRLAGRYLRYNSLFIFYLLRDAVLGTPRWRRSA